MLPSIAIARGLKENEMGKRRKKRRKRKKRKDLERTIRDRDYVGLKARQIIISSRKPQMKYHFYPQTKHGYWKSTSYLLSTSPQLTPMKQCPSIRRTPMPSHTPINTCTRLRATLVFITYTSSILLKANKSKEMVLLLDGKWEIGTPYERMVSDEPR